VGVRLCLYLDGELVIPMLPSIRTVYSTHYNSCKIIGVLEWGVVSSSGWCSFVSPMPQSGCETIGVNLNGVCLCGEFMEWV